MGCILGCTDVTSIDSAELIASAEILAERLSQGDRAVGRGRDGVGGAPACTVLSEAQAQRSLRQIRHANLYRASAGAAVELRTTNVVGMRRVESISARGFSRMRVSSELSVRSASARVDWRAVVRLGYVYCALVRCHQIR